LKTLLTKVLKAIIQRLTFHEFRIQEVPTLSHLETLEHKPSKYWWILRVIKDNDSNVDCGFPG
jgi:hypothetical protein